MRSAAHVAVPGRRNLGLLVPVPQASVDMERGSVSTKNPPSQPLTPGFGQPRQSSHGTHAGPPPPRLSLAWTERGHRDCRWPRVTGPAAGLTQPRAGQDAAGPLRCPGAPPSLARRSVGSPPPGGPESTHTRSHGGVHPRASRQRAAPRRPPSAGRRCRPSSPVAGCGASARAAAVKEGGRQRGGSAPGPLPAVGSPGSRRAQAGGLRH